VNCVQAPGMKVLKPEIKHVDSGHKQFSYGGNKEENGSLMYY